MKRSNITTLLTVFVGLGFMVAAGAMTWRDAKKATVATKPAPKVSAIHKLRPRPALINTPEKIRIKLIKASNEKGKIVSTYIVSGAGTAGVDGTYAAAGTSNGVPYYSNGTNFLFRFVVIAPANWYIGPAIDASSAYYRNTDTGATPPASGWTVNVLGTSPAPTVALSGGTTPTASFAMLMVSD